MSKNNHWASNNKYFDCPPRMADGRHFTDYRPNCDLNNKGDLNSNEYRNHLIRDAEKIMKSNKDLMCEKNCCGVCMEPYNVGTMLPEKTKIVCNAKGCSKIMNNQDGLGQGRIYTNN